MRGSKVRVLSIVCCPSCLLTTGTEGWLAYELVVVYYCCNLRWCTLHLSPSAVYICQALPATPTPALPGLACRLMRSVRTELSTGHPSRSGQKSGSW